MSLFGQVSVWRPYVIPRWDDHTDLNCCVLPDHLQGRRYVGVIGDDDNLINLA